MSFFNHSNSPYNRDHYAMQIQILLLYRDKEKIHSEIELII